MRNPLRAKRTGAEQVGAFLSQWAQRRRRQDRLSALFCLDGAKISDDDLGREDMLLPLFLWHADRIYRYAVSGAGLGVRFPRDDSALLMCGAKVDWGLRSKSELFLFSLEAADDAFENLPRSQALEGAAELRSLVDRFSVDMKLLPPDGVSPASSDARARPEAPR